MRHEENYWVRRGLPGRVSRRRFVGGAAAGGVGLAGLGLVGCGDDDDDGNGGAPTATATTAPGETPGATPTATPTPADAITRGGIVRGVWLGGSQFDSVDVHRAFRDEVQWLSNQILNKIIRFSNPDAGELDGDLAEEWETPDAQNYVFKIRQDVFWQDTPLTNGRQLTAEDIKWHIERQRDGKLSDGTEVPFRFQSDYAGVTVETPDDFTVRLTLPKPNGAFLTKIAAFRATVPNRETVEKFEGDHTTLTEEAMPATGAFVLKHWRANEDLYVERNPNHFRAGEPIVDGMILPIGLFADPTAHRLAFEQKQVDWVYQPDVSVTKAIIDASGGQMKEVLTGVANPVFLHLNMNQQFKDLRLVRAVNMAIDRRTMIQLFHQGLGQVSGPVTWLQEGFALPQDELITYEGYRVDRDLEIKEARALWEAADGPALGTVDIGVTDTWLGPWPDTNQILQAMLNEALGVSQFTSSRVTYNDDIIPLLSQGTFVNWMSWTSQVDSADPRPTLFASYHSAGSTNFQHVNNPDLDTLLENALTTPDLEEARELTREAQRIILENGMYGNCMLYNYIGRTAYWNYFHGAWKVDPEPGGATPGQGYNIFAGHLGPGRTWIDQNDPTYDASIGQRKF
ncbi:MAG: hypothetical protein Kow0010_18640 [Dehalococcoidia bacterium]